MKRLQVKQGDKWLYVFGYSGEKGTIITLADNHYRRALPAIDLAFMANKFGNDTFRVI